MANFNQVRNYLETISVPPFGNVGKDYANPRDSFLFNSNDDSNITHIELHFSKHEQSDEVPYKLDGLDLEVKEGIVHEVKYLGPDYGQVCCSAYFRTENSEKSIKDKTAGVLGHCYGADCPIFAKAIYEVAKKFGILGDLSTNSKLKNFVHKRISSYSVMSELEMSIRNELKSIFSKHKSDNSQIEIPNVDNIDETSFDILDSFIKAYKNDVRVSKDLMKDLIELKSKYKF